MSINIQRCFHPVGQGAFYTERFRIGKQTINVVYDCGSATSLSDLKKIINNHFPKSKEKEPEIEFLFISHFHHDHVCGLEHLLKLCRVKYVFVLLIHQDNVNVLLSLLNNFEAGGDKFVEAFILSPENTVRLHGQKSDGFAPNVIFVPPTTNEDGEQTDSPIPFNPNEFETRSTNQQSNAKGFVLPRGQHCFTFPQSLEVEESKSQILHKWCFIPFNFEFKERSWEFRQKLIEARIPIETVDDVKKVWQDEKSRKNLKDAFDEVSNHKPNDNTLSLYSGPCRSDNFPSGLSFLISSNSLFPPTYFCRHLRYCCARFQHCGTSPCVPSNRLGAIYMGDFNPDQSGKTSSRVDFKKKYRQWEDCVEILQIPHHGSRDNFHEDFAQIGRYHVISAGIKNRYGHPHPTVIQKILNLGGCPLLVTESPNSEVVQNIEIAR